MNKEFCSHTTQGGCSCKLSSSLLNKVLENLSLEKNSEIVANHGSRDDAAIIKSDLFSENGLMAISTDFQLAPLEDPYSSGVVVSANAISDIYAMAASPAFALVILGFPVDKFEDPGDIGKQVMNGIQHSCEECGIAIVGGHTINSNEPLLGLTVVGYVNPIRLRTNAMACEGDLLVLTKPVGTGVAMAGRKINMLGDSEYQNAIKIMSNINSPGEWLGEYSEVHAVTDVTGFGLLGHMLEICKESKVSMKLNVSNVPKLDSAVELITNDVWPSAALHNLNDIRSSIEFAATVTQGDKILMCDPQTNGGLLFTCTHEAVNGIIDRLKNTGFYSAAIIGEVCAENSINMISVYK